MRRARCARAKSPRLCAGGIRQSPSDYRRIIGLKTAELFRLSCQLGSRLAGFDDGFVEAASAFGQRLGTAYQMYDDLADFFGEEKRIGKTLGTDLSGGKVTLPTLVLLNKLPAKERDELLEEIRERRSPPLERRRALMSTHGVFAEVAESVRVELEAGVALLAPWAHLDPTPLLVQLLGLLQDQVNSLSGGPAA